MDRAPEVALLAPELEPSHSAATTAPAGPQGAWTVTTRVCLCPPGHSSWRSQARWAMLVTYTLPLAHLQMMHLLAGDPKDGI